MQVLLLNVTSLSLEGGVSLAAVDQSMARDDTYGRTSGQDVEKCSFTRT